MLRKTVLAVATLLISTSGAYAQTTLLSLNSQPGDYIGQGQQRTWTAADGRFSAQNNFDNGVSLSFSGNDPSVWWYLDFAAPGNLRLAPGVYEHATRFPFQQATVPGLNVSGEGRGCNTLTGRFEVLEATYGPSGEVLTFAADFEQHCEGSAPALSGFDSLQRRSGAEPLHFSHGHGQRLERGCRGNRHQRERAIYAGGNTHAGAKRARQEGVAQRAQQAR